MKILGTTDDGRRITERLVQGVKTQSTETVEERDLRRETEAYELVRNTAPELLQACRGLLAIMPDLEKFLTVEGEARDETGFTDEEQQAIDYALLVVRKVDPDYGRAQEPPPAVEVTP